MERKADWEVGGFQFGSEKDVELAKTEQEKIGFMEKRMRYDQPETVLAIYNKAIENRIFQTPVGLQYLQRLHDFLLEQGVEGRAYRFIRYTAIILMKSSNRVRLSDVCSQVSTDSFAPGLGSLLSSIFF